MVIKYIIKNANQILAFTCSSPASSLESTSSHHHHDLGSSPSLSYGIASLIADKHPSSSSKSHVSSSSNSGSGSSSQAEVSFTQGLTFLGGGIETVYSCP